MAYRRKSGLGTCYTTTTTGGVVDCDAFEGFFQSACWVPNLPCGNSAATATNMYAQSSLNLPPASAPPVAPGSLTPTDPNAIVNSTDPQALVNALAAQALANTQAAINAANPPDTPPASTPLCGQGAAQWIQGIDNCAVIAAAALALLFVGIGVGKR